jgi:site-specific recombinase XerD
MMTTILCAHLLRAGVHPKVVCERLGHSRVGITLDTYSHVLPVCRRTLIGALQSESCKEDHVSVHFRT